jgi:hypothetical protein
MENLDSTEKDILLRWFLYYMPMGMGETKAEPTEATRGEFMRQYPQIYNKFAGRDIVKVVRVSDNTPI